MQMTTSWLCAAWLATSPPQGEGWVVHAVALNAGGDTTAFGRIHAEKGGGALVLRDAKAGTCREIPCDTVVRDLDFSRDGRRLAVARDDGGIWVLDVATGRRLAVHTAHDGWTLAVALSAEGEQVLSGGRDGVLRLAEAASGKETWRVQRKEAVSVVAFAPDGLVACARHHGAIELWRPGDAEPRVLGPCDRTVQALAFSPDGRLLAGAGRQDEGFLFDIATGAVTARWHAHSKPVRALRFEADGKTLLAASDDRCVRRVRTADGQVLREMQFARVPMAIELATDGKPTVADAEGKTERLRTD